MIEMRLFVSVFFREFAGAKLALSTTDKSMRILDRFHIAPNSRRCEVTIPEQRNSRFGKTETGKGESELVN